MQQELT